MDISTIGTNYSGMLPDVRVVTLNEWSDKYLRPVKALMGSIEIKEAHGIVGQWIAQLKTNDEHIYSYFRENFTPASLDPKPDIFCYAFTEIDDEIFLKSFHDTRTSNRMESFINETSQYLALRAYREGLVDRQLLKFDRLSMGSKVEAALRKPAAMYVPELNIFLMVNVNCYQVMRSQGIFGLLKRFILSKIPVEQDGTIAEPSAVWFPLNASAVQVIHDDGEQSGLAFLSVDPALKASLAITLTDRFPDAKFISSDMLYVNPGSKKMVPIEKKSYLPGSIIAENLRLLPGALSRGFENLRLDGDTAECLNKLDPSSIRDNVVDEVLPQSVIASLRKSLNEKRVFTVFDPADIWPKTRTSVSALLDTLFIVKRDYDDNRIVAPISAEEAITLLLARDNVPAYEEAGAGYSHTDMLYSSTVPLFDNHLTTPLREPKRWEIDKQETLMRKLISGALNLCLLNIRIPFSQLNFCVINYILGAVSSVKITTEKQADKILCAKLRLLRKTKNIDGINVPCLFSPDGREVNILSFTKTSGTTYYAALDTQGEERNQVKSYSRGTVADFFTHHARLTSRTILQQFR